jgi:5-methyltetrahydrofolate--homocysteine methyltransferase
VREAVGENGCVALSMGTTGGFLKPVGALSAEEVLTAFARQAKAGAGADAVYIETMTDIAETRLAAIAALESTNQPVVASFTFEGERLLTGGLPETAALILEAVGVSALASTAPAARSSLKTRSRACGRSPRCRLSSSPTRACRTWKTARRYSAVRAEMAPKMRRIVQAGAAAIGGCCGTTPEHIALFKQIAQGIGPFVPAAEKKAVAATTRAVFALDAIGDAFEKIEPDVDALYDADPDAPAVQIDVSSLSMDEIEELMLEAANILKTPLCIDSGDEEKLRWALKCYAGIALTHGTPSYGACAYKAVHRQTLFVDDWMSTKSTSQKKWKFISFGLHGFPVALLFTAGKPCKEGKSNDFPSVRANESPEPIKA